MLKSLECGKKHTKNNTLGNKHEHMQDVSLREWKLPEFLCQAEGPRVQGHLALDGQDTVRSGKIQEC